MEEGAHEITMHEEITMPIDLKHHVPTTPNAALYNPTVFNTITPTPWYHSLLFAPTRSHQHHTQPTASSTLRCPHHRSPRLRRHHGPI
jgi:hypothetical protein